MGLKKRIVVVAAISLASVASSSLTAGSLTSDERAALVVLIVAAGLWMTEAVPLAATALLIPVMQSVLGVQGFGAALAPFFDTVVMLLLGGFLLAVAVEKYDLDEYFAYQILSRVRARASVVMLVIMGTAAFLSMWISNTAATALLITMGLNVC